MSESPDAAIQEPAPSPEPTVGRPRKRRSGARRGGTPKPDDAADGADGREEPGGAEGTPAEVDAATPEALEAPETQGPEAEAPGAGGEGQPVEAELPTAASDAQDGPSDEDLVRHVSALLFASPDPLGAARLASVLGTTQARIKPVLEQIEQRLAESGLGFELRRLAGGSTFMTPPALGDLVAGLSKNASVERISPAALETLAVIAYRQPVTKAEIEAIRGVQAGPVLRSLVDRGLVRVLGRSEDPGHALQYGTAKEFLSRFGLDSLDELPRDGELARD